MLCETPKDLNMHQDMYFIASNMI